MFANMVKMLLPRSVTDHIDENEAILISTNVSGIRNGKILKEAWNVLAKKCEMIDTYWNAQVSSRKYVLPCAYQ